MKSSQPSGPSRAVRFRSGSPAVVHYRGVDYPCRAHDVSRSGVLLVGPIPWPADPIVEFTMRAPAGTLEVTLQGAVVRVSEHDDGTMLAMEFRDTGPKQREQLEGLLARIKEGRTPGPLEALRPGAPTHEVRTALEAIPLPHRVALAVRATNKEREFLLQDVNPQVLEALARNPNLLRNEILELLESNCLLPSTLDLLARDPRWEKDDDIRVLIATHRRVHVPLAIRLIEALPRKALDVAIKRPTLHPAVRSRIVRRIARG